MIARIQVVAFPLKYPLPLGGDAVVKQHRCHVVVSVQPVDLLNGLQRIEREVYFLADAQGMKKLFRTA